jgi:hypothetical protein
MMPTEDEIEKFWKELREMFPGCSFEIAHYTNADFLEKEPRQKVEVHIIESQYRFHERFVAPTLKEVMSFIIAFQAKRVCKALHEFIETGR